MSRNRQPFIVYAIRKIILKSIVVCACIIVFSLLSVPKSFAATHGGKITIDGTNTGLSGASISVRLNDETDGSICGTGSDTTDSSGNYSVFINDTNCEGTFVDWRVTASKTGYVTKTQSGTYRKPPGTVLSSFSLSLDEPDGPNAPTGLNATPGACGTASIIVSWNSVSGADSYQLYRNGTQISSASTTTRTVTSLTPGNSYSFYVRATDNGVQSSNSNSDSAIAPTECVTPPTSTPISTPTSTISTPTTGAPTTTGTPPPVSCVNPYTTTLYPIEDASIKGGALSGNNYGSSSVLDIGSFIWGDDGWAFAYLKYNIPSQTVLGGTRVESAELQPSMVTLGPILSNIRAFPVSSSVWSQNTLTWNNAPGAGSALPGAVPAYSAPVPALDVTEYVQSNLDRTTSISLGLGPPIPVAAAQLGSREANNNNNPLTIVTCDDAPSTPTVTSPPPSGSISGRVYEVTSANPGFTGARVDVFQQNGLGLTYITTDFTDSTGAYTLTGLNPAYVYRVELSNAAAICPGCGIVVPTNGNNFYMSVTAGSTRNFGLQRSSPPPPTLTPILTGEPTLTTEPPTNTPTPPDDDLTTRVLLKNSDGTETPLQNSLISVYDETPFGFLFPRDAKYTDSDGYATWATISGGDYGYRIILADKGPGRSGYDIIVPNTGVNYYTSVVKGSSRTFVLQDSSTGTPTPTPDVPGSDPYSISGQIVTANNLGECLSSPLPTSLASLSLYSEAGTLVNSMNQKSTYNFTGLSDATLDHYLSLSVPAGFTLIGVRDGSGSYVPSSFTDYPLTNFASNHTARSVSFCLKAASLGDTPWFMTEIGSVRQQSIYNPVPLGYSASSASANASVFYSTLGNAALGASSGLKWQVNKEYAKVPAFSRPGNASFSFYKNRAQTASVIADTLPGCGPSNCVFTGSMDDLGANNIYLVDGDLTMNPSNPILTNGNRYIIIADGNITFERGVTITDDKALLIFAAKNNIYIRPSVGTDLIDETPVPYSIQAILSAENNIIIQSIASCPTTSDKRLNIEGSLIANADNPFGVDTSGGGILDNQRTLCDDNVKAPTLYVKSRLSFIIGLTDFYKVSSRFWNEVTP